MTYLEVYKHSNGLAAVGEDVLDAVAGGGEGGQFAADEMLANLRYEIERLGVCLLGFGFDRREEFDLSKEKKWNVLLSKGRHQNRSASFEPLGVPLVESSHLGWEGAPPGKTVGAEGIQAGSVGFYGQWHGYWLDARSEIQESLKPDAGGWIVFGVARRPS
ncbi:hypothetical protein B0H13DRAFT_1897489 [Mycena leptocephala]|nr:hypothetical protein B0H13DRAFT_1910499 [Mycena leptocephala]KAJ7867651.1 hypothetical protein B0H13DRAFT_1897489 [Mycena leptocephala]